VHDVASRLLMHESPIIRANTLIATTKHLRGEGKTYYHEAMNASRKNSQRSRSVEVQEREHRFRHFTAQGLFVLGERSVEFLSEIVANDPSVSVREEAAAGLARVGLEHSGARVEAAEGLVFGIEMSEPDLSGLCANGIRELAVKSHEENDRAGLNVLEKKILPAIESKMKEMRQSGPVGGTEHEPTMAALVNTINAIRGEPPAKKRR